MEGEDDANADTSSIKQREFSDVHLIISHVFLFFFLFFLFFPVKLYYSCTLMFSLFYSIVAMLLCVVLYAP